ncbi:MAG: hypothetical protein ACOCXT_02880 [Candidatus Dojkabacteria bacterium]
MHTLFAINEGQNGLTFELGDYSIKQGITHSLLKEENSGTRGDSLALPPYSSRSIVTVSMLPGGEGEQITTATAISRPIGAGTEKVKKWLSRFEQDEINDPSVGRPTANALQQYGQSILIPMPNQNYTIPVSTASSRRVRILPAMLSFKQGEREDLIRFSRAVPLIGRLVYNQHPSIQHSINDGSKDKNLPFTTAKELADLASRLFSNVYASCILAPNASAQRYHKETIALIHNALSKEN